MWHLGDDHALGVLGHPYVTSLGKDIFRSRTVSLQANKQKTELWSIDLARVIQKRDF